MEPVSPVLPSQSDLPEIEAGKNQPEYNNLPVLNLGEGVLLSRWKLTEEELAIIQKTGDLYVFIHTFGHPVQPINLQAEEPRDGDEVVPFVEVDPDDPTKEIWPQVIGDPPANAVPIDPSHFENHPDDLTTISLSQLRHEYSFDCSNSHCVGCPAVFSDDGVYTENPYDNFDPEDGPEPSGQDHIEVLFCPCECHKKGKYPEDYEDPLPESKSDIDDFIDTQNEQARTVVDKTTKPGDDISPQPRTIFFEINGISKPFNIMGAVEFFTGRVLIEKAMLHGYISTVEPDRYQIKRLEFNGSWQAINLDDPAGASEGSRFEISPVDQPELLPNKIDSIPVFVEVGDRIHRMELYGNPDQWNGRNIILQAISSNIFPSEDAAQMELIKWYSADGSHTVIGLDDLAGIDDLTARFTIRRKKSESFTIADGSIKTITAYINNGFGSNVPMIFLDTPESPAKPTGRDIIDAAINVEAITDPDPDHWLIERRLPNGTSMVIESNSDAMLIDECVYDLTILNSKGEL